MKFVWTGRRALASAAAAIAVVGAVAALDVGRANAGAVAGLHPPAASAPPSALAALPATGSAPPAPAGVPAAATPPAGSVQQVSDDTPELPTPTVNLPTVPALATLREVDAVVTLPKTVSPGEVAALEQTAGIAAVEEVDTGTVTFDGAPAAAFGIDPGTFRDFTPQVTASESKLWQYVAAGALASSFDMATDRKLTLGSRLPLVGAGPRHTETSGWLGAFLSIGIPGVDLVVDQGYSAALGLVPDSGLIVSAPGMNSFELQQDLQSELPGADVELTHSDVNLGSAAASFVASQTLSAVISAALSRVGDPYVWGGDGPTDFDCSGLVGWAFAQAGISMPRTAAQQALTGPRETLAQAQPGDLLFWTYDPTDPTFIDHVALYLGNGQMVVAPHTGTDVQVAPVPTQDFAGAVRVNPAAAASVGGARFP